MTLTVDARGDGSPSIGRDVQFESHNGQDCGSFNPDPASTNAQGVAKIIFTAGQVTGNGNQGNAQVDITSGPQHKLSVIHVRKN